MSVVFTVSGIPAPQGSKKAFKRGRKIVVVEMSKRLPAWREDVHKAARNAMSGLPVFDGPVQVRVVFRFVRPKSVKPEARPLPSVRPDVDKLARGLLDGLTGVVFTDDAQVTDLHVTKRYADFPGATVTVQEAKELVTW